MTFTLDKTQYERLTRMREAGDPKTAQCKFLGIKYNTKRLDTLYIKFEADQENAARLRAKKRGQPLEGDELAAIITEYISGTSITEISDRFFRSSGIIRLKLSQSGALIRSREKVDPNSPPMLPDECVADSFAIGQKVWIPGYQSLGEIDKEIPNGYRIYLLNADKQQYVNIATCDIGSLQHLEALGVNTQVLDSSMNSEEIKELVVAARVAASKTRTTMKED